MTDPLLIIAIVLLVGVLLCVLGLLKRATQGSGAADAAVIASRIEAFQREIERVERSVREEIANSRKEMAQASGGQREELAGVINKFGNTVGQRLTELAMMEKAELGKFAEQLARLTQSNEGKLEAVRATVEGKLTQMQADNAAKLDQMRATVDEKLQSTLEKRLGESFKLVSERLEQVHKGLGEMQTLAAGVGDLKKVLSNVKVRGTWAEVSLGALLEQVLTAEQYACNKITRKGGSEPVEFAIRLPGQDGQGEVWLPVDAKFPQEDYVRLVEASERGDAAAVEDAAKALEARIKGMARDIRDKYLDPPHTTNFGILYLPTEGLYAEVLRRPGLLESLQRDGVVPTGPTTIAALLNSLQMGFRTVAITKRASEVWQVLGAVKAEFGKFGDILDKVHKQLSTAANTIDDATRKTRTIERRLRSVEQLPQDQSSQILPALVEEPEADGEVLN